MQSYQNSPDGGVLHNINRWEESSNSMSSTGRYPMIGEYAQRQKKKKAICVGLLLPYHMPDVSMSHSCI